MKLKQYIGVFALGGALATAAALEVIMHDSDAIAKIAKATNETRRDIELQLLMCGTILEITSLIALGNAARAYINRAPGRKAAREDLEEHERIRQVTRLENWQKTSPESARDRVGDETEEL